MSPERVSIREKEEGHSVVDGPKTEKNAGTNSGESRASIVVICC